MADLGVYNFIRAALARGETKEQISAMLLKNGQPQASIDDAFAAAQKRAPPVIRGDLQEPPRRSGLLKNIFGTLAILLVVAALILAYLVHAGTVKLPRPQELMSASVASCAPSDDCVRGDLDKINAEARALFEYANHSYATLCAGGVVNVNAAQGADRDAMNINASLRNAVNQILLTRGAPSQQDAGISCGSASDRFYVNAAMQDESAGSDYCLDSRGVATTSPPNTGTTFCGSKLTQI